LQGNLDQRAREKVVTAFRSNQVRILVATNVGARGLDVSGIAHVINFDLPESSELFTHRVGRTGRNGASGTAITFITGEDRLKWREIERAMKEKGIPLTRKNWDGPRANPKVIPLPVQSRPPASFNPTPVQPKTATGFSAQPKPAQRPTRLRTEKSFPTNGKQFNPAKQSNSRRGSFSR
jgi:ATP-dependent RNA helicase DeaD